MNLLLFPSVSGREIKCLYRHIIVSFPAASTKPFYTLLSPTISVVVKFRVMRAHVHSPTLPAIATCPQQEINSIFQILSTKL